MLIELSSYIKKILILLVIFIITSPNLAAQDWQVDSGPSYNNFRYRQYKSGIEQKRYPVKGSLNQGWGLYSQLDYSVNKDWNLGIGVEKMLTNYEYSSDATLQYDLSGLYTELSYALQPQVKLTSGVGYYLYSEEDYQNNNLEKTLKDVSGLSISCGWEFTYLLSDNLSINLSILYRLANTGINRIHYQSGAMILDPNDERLIIDGLATRIGLSYQF